MERGVEAPRVEGGGDGGGGGGDGGVGGGIEELGRRWRWWSRWCKWRWRRWSWWRRSSIGVVVEGGAWGGRTGCSTAIDWDSEDVIDTGSYFANASF